LTTGAQSVSSILPRISRGEDANCSTDTATVDYDGVYEKERHMFRLATMAEKPIPVHTEED
jgi:hypothetical protein